MSARSGELSVDPDIYQGRIRRLLVPVKPMPSETLHSYLYRLTEGNHLFPAWLPSLARNPGFLAKLAVLTDYSHHQLVAMLPELRSPFHMRCWPHLIGEPSAHASTRAPCSHCAAARIGTTDTAVTVFAKHEQLICHRHQRWLGNYQVKCAFQEQFSVASCPEVAIANRRHERLIARWGRGPTRASFEDAIECMKTWARWIPVVADPEVKRRWTLLGITEATPPHQPREIAALYPDTVALTELILTLRRRISHAHRITAEIGADSIRLLSATVTAGLTPRGAGDPFRRALMAVRSESTSEAEIFLETGELEI